MNGLARTLTKADLPAALVLSAVAGWNQTEADWNRLLQLDGKRCFCIECDSSAVATTTLVTYGDEMGWVGMVLTHPDYRRRGFARRLVEHALAYAESRKICCLKLDATEQGVALYRSLGFREEQAIERWWGVGRSAPVVCERGLLSPTHLALDRKAFGANRGEVLQSFGETALLEREGFAMSREGACAVQLGPCVAASAASAERLLAGVSAHSGELYWDLLPANAAAVEIAQELRFQPARRLVRMVKGENRRGDESMIYAAGGFELG